MILGLDLSNSIYHGYKKVNNCSYCMLRNLNEVHIFIEKKVNIILYVIIYVRQCIQVFQLIHVFVKYFEKQM